MSEERRDGAHEPAVHRGRAKGSCARAFIAAGSSIEPRRNLREALRLLMQRVDVTGVSSVYRTPAIGRPRDPDFFDCVWRVGTTLAPRTMKREVLVGVESALGRRQMADKYAPRTIDLDLILYNGLMAEEPDLHLPHPDVGRWFVAAGLLELDAKLEVPGGSVDLQATAAATGGVDPEAARDEALTVALRAVVREGPAGR